MFGGVRSCLELFGVVQGYSQLFAVVRSYLKIFTMALVVKHLLAFLRRALVGITFDVGRDVVEEVWEEVQRLLLRVLERWQVVESVDAGGSGRE